LKSPRTHDGSRLPRLGTLRLECSNQLGLVDRMRGHPAKGGSPERVS